MEDQLLNSPEKIDAAISNFTDLQQHPGWLLLKQIVNINIVVLTDQILSGGQPEEEINRLRDKLQINKEIINTPSEQVKQLNIDKSPTPIFDPYDKPVLTK